MSLGLATIGLGLPLAIGAALALVVALRGRRGSPRAFWLVMPAAVAEVVLVLTDLLLVGVGIIQQRSLPYATQTALDTLSSVLVLCQVLAAVPLVWAMGAGRWPWAGARLRAGLWRDSRTGPSAPQPRVRARWEEVLPKRGERPPDRRPPAPPAR